MSLVVLSLISFPKITMLAESVCTFLWAMLPSFPELPGGSAGRNPPANTGNSSFIPGSGRSPLETDNGSPT